MGKIAWRRIGVAAWVALALVLLAGPVLAAYTASIVVSEGSATTYEMVGLSRSVDIGYMAENQFISVNGNDTRVEMAGTIIPHMLAADRLNFALQLSGNTTKALEFSTGNEGQTWFEIIPGYEGYATIADAAALEPGDNFEIEFEGYIDTSVGSDKSLLSKLTAMRMYVSGTSEITAAILDVSTADAYLLPNGHHGCAVSFEAGCPACNTHWQCVDDPWDTPDDASTYIYTQETASYQTDLYLMQDGAIGTSGVINTVTVYYRVRNAGAAGAAYATIYLDGQYLYSGAVTPQAAWTTVNYEFSRPGGGDWMPEDIPNIIAGVNLKKAGGSPTECTQVYVKVNYTPYVETTVVTATGVSSGEHIVGVTANTTDLKIWIDSIEEDSTALSGDSIPDTAYDWTIMDNAATDVTPYWDWYKHTVGGSLVVWYQPDTIIVGTNLPDRQGTSQNATITWGSNPSGVTVTMAGLISDVVGDARYVDPEMQDVLDPLTPEVSPTEAATLARLALVPGLYTLTVIIEEQTGIPVILQWRVGLFLVAIIVFVVMYARYPNMILSGAVMNVPIGLGVVLLVFPFYTLGLIVLFLVGLTVLQSRIG